MRKPASAEMVDRPTVGYTGEFVNFEAHEIAALARHAHDPQDATLYLTAAWTGLRQGELLALRWRDIDFAGQRVNVRRAWSQAAQTEKSPKSGKVRSVPLVAELIAPLGGLSRRGYFTGEEDLVFCSEVGATWTPGGSASAIRPRSRPSAEGCPLHDLRHCFGSVAVRAFPLSDVQAMLGHAHVTTTMRYVHHRPGADDAARLSSAFRGDDVTPLVTPVSRDVSRNGRIGAN